MADYHAGRDGRVWLAISAKGQLAVLKFSSQPDPLTSLTEESRYWNEIWDCTTKVITLYSQYCLVMPFVFHYKLINGRLTIANYDVWPANFHDHEHAQLETFDLGNYIPIDVAREALKGMARKRYRHNDIEWRHVGLMPFQDTKNNRSWKLKPVMLDLSDITQTIDEYNIEEIIRNLEADLEQ